jgi:UDPglucose--hexose-1-phosphate uridylyltransferase
MEFLFSDHPHRRLNPLTGQWVLVSPHRTKRPWQGKKETHAVQVKPEYDPNCYLCPGNKRANGETNPRYSSTYVFTNDFSALLEKSPPIHAETFSLINAQNADGTCRVICFSPRHDLTLPFMPIETIKSVIDVWAEQTADLGGRYRWVQIFENKGDIMGCSNPHPHGQIWASSFLPNEPFAENARLKEYARERHSNMLVDYAEFEARDGGRISLENDQWIAVVPFWAVWPYETLVIPRRHVLRLDDLNTEERHSLAVILKRLLIKYDNLFSTSFPYSAGWHGAPYGPEDFSHWQLHAHFYPPLLRSCSIKKFMVGYELLSEVQRDITPEQAAERLRTLPETHYSETSKER